MTGFEPTKTEHATTHQARPSLMRARDGRSLSPAVCILRYAVRFYQLTLARFLGGQCRFGPSCSEYAMEALATHGAVRGGWLAVRRFGRCHPWGGHGYDPVPPAPVPPAPVPPATVAQAEPGQSRNNAWPEETGEQKTNDAIFLMSSVGTGHSQKRTVGCEIRK